MNQRTDFDASFTDLFQKEVAIYTTGLGLGLGFGLGLGLGFGLGLG